MPETSPAGEERADWAFRRLLAARGATFPPAPPSDVWTRWVNSALRARSERDLAIDEVRRIGLPPHPDPPKNWDSLIGLGLILQRTGPEARLLDAGAAPYSVLLPWLYLYGYQDLWGIDLTYEGERRHGTITYQRGDIERTGFDDGAFDVVMCLSVIEHGVSAEAYFREAARILRPGGLLFTSTDYWCEAIDTEAATSYGVPVTVFTPVDVSSMLQTAAAHGLHPRQPIRMDCEERVVHWAQHGLDYTFINFALELQQ